MIIDIDLNYFSNANIVCSLTKVNAPTHHWITIKVFGEREKLVRVTYLAVRWCWRSEYSSDTLVPHPLEEDYANTFTLFLNLIFWLKIHIANVEQFRADTWYHFIAINLNSCSNRRAMRKNWIATYRIHPLCRWKMNHTIASKAVTKRSQKATPKAKNSTLLTYSCILASVWFRGNSALNFIPLKFSCKIFEKSVVRIVCLGEKKFSFIWLSFILIHW